MPEKRAASNDDHSPKDPPPALHRLKQTDGQELLATLRHPLKSTLPGPSSSPFATAPAFQKPMPFCSFSFDAQRRLWHDDRCKKYYRGPPPQTGSAWSSRSVGIDLNYGMERFKQRDESVPEHLDALVNSLEHRSTVTMPHADEERRRADVVTWRGIMTKLCTAYHQSASARISDPFELNVMMVDGTLYLEEYVSAQSKADKQKREQDPAMQRFGYYGYSFESYCAVDSPDQVSSFPQPAPPEYHPVGWAGDVDTNVQWCQVVRTKLGAHRLIIGGEVDAVTKDQTGKEQLVELKTSMAITPFHRNRSRSITDQAKFEQKLLKFFLQSYLLGIATIVVGFRDYHGNLTAHQPFETLKLPRMVRAGHPIAGQVGPHGEPVTREESVWDPKDSLGFADQILSFVRRAFLAHTNEDGLPLLPPDEAVVSTPVYRLSFLSPFEQLEFRALTKEEINTQVKDGGTSGERVGFLPLSFYRFVYSCCQDGLAK